MKRQLRSELDDIEYRLVDKDRGDAVQAFNTYGEYLDANCTKEELIGLVLSGYEFNNLEDRVIETHGTPGAKERLKKGREEARVDNIVEKYWERRAADRKDNTVNRVEQIGKVSALFPERETGSWEEHRRRFPDYPLYLSGNGTLYTQGPLKIFFVGVDDPSIA